MNISWEGPVQICDGLYHTEDEVGESGDESLAWIT